MGDSGIENPAFIKVHRRSEKTEKLMSACRMQLEFPQNVWLHPNHQSQLHSVVPPGHVRVKLTMRPIQHVDVRIIRTGGYRELRNREFVTIGAEGVGTVHEVGSDVKSELRENQRVVPVLFWDNLLEQGIGSWQYYVDVAEENVMILPDVPKESPGYVPDEAAAQFVITPWTALGLFHTAVAGMAKDGFLLLSAPTSTIGRHILGIAKNKEINVIAIVRKDYQKKLFEDMGVKYVVNCTAEDVVEQIKSLTGDGGAYAAIDGVGADTTMKLGACLRDRGELLVYNNAAGTDSDDHIKISLGDLKRRIQVQWWTLTDYLNIRSGDKQKIRQGMQKLYYETVELYRRKILLFPTYEKKFSFSQLAEALELIDQTKNEFYKRKALLINQS